VEIFARCDKFHEWLYQSHLNWQTIPNSHCEFIIHCRVPTEISNFKLTWTLYGSAVQHFQAKYAFILIFKRLFYYINIKMEYIFLYTVIINNCSRSKPCPCYEIFAALFEHNSNVVWTVNSVNCVFTFSHSFNHFHMERQP
jgi:hypothetical protein